VLTPPLGEDLNEDLRLTSGLRLTPVFGMNVANRRQPNDLPAIGTAEHTALLSGPIDLADLERAMALGDDWPAPVMPSGITASWLLPDAEEPSMMRPVPPLPAVHANDAPAGSGSASIEVRSPTGRAAHPSLRADFPSRRSLRPATRAITPIGVPTGLRMPIAPVGKRLSGDVLLPGPRWVPGAGSPRATVRPAPPVVTGPPTAALRISEVEQTLAASPQSRAVTDDPTPTGELVRPFVAAAGLADAEWAGVDSVPPPVSVDVFQRSVAASLKKSAQQARADALGDTDADLTELESDLADDSLHLPSSKTRRQARAGEKAANSPRAIAVRRIAKGTVLAVTALGVAGTATPQAFNALGMPHDSGPLARTAVDFAGALAPHDQDHPLTALQLAQQRTAALQVALRRDLADATVDSALDAAAGTGGALVDLALQNDAAEQARRQAAMAHAAREAVRDPKSYAIKLVEDRGWSDSQFQCLDRLWTRESNWKYRASNSASGAVGIPQALPGSKMAAVANDWQTNPVTQMKWGLNYITQRYGTPCSAWTHSQQSGWY
jgi:hypothetical protein